MNDLNVILIDDEDLVLEDLKTMIDWEAEGFRIAGTAFNGRQTAVLLGSVRPDIVFMDVSLPDTDGIRLSRGILSRFPDAVIIILSGYMDFSYAQGAVEIGALAYLVKHQLTPGKLLEVLSNARDIIEKRQISRLLGSRLLLRDILEHGYSEAAETPELPELLARYRDSFLLLVFTPLEPCFSSPAEPRRLQLHMFDLMDAAMPEFHILDILIFRSDVLVFISPENGFRTGNRYLGKLGLQIERLQEKLGLQTSQSFFALCLKAETTLSSLHRDYQLLDAARDSRCFYPDRNVLFLNRTKASPVPSPDLGFISRTGFLDGHQAFMQELSDCFDQILRTKDSAAFFECCRRVCDLLSELGLHARTAPDYAACCYAEELSALLLTECRECYQEYQLQSRYAPSTNYMLQYIREHYSSDPSLAEAAARLRSNPMYLGQKFKKDTGQTFHDALNDYRITVAKELLSSTSLKIFEVSARVGICNSQYFSKIFREKTGCTPNEYRFAHFSLTQEES